MEELILDIDSFCKEHSHPYTQYCNKCASAFCDLCPVHNDQHIVVPLLSVITPEVLGKLLEDTLKRLEEIDHALIIIPQIVDKLQNFENVIPWDMKKDSTTLKEEEKKISEQIKELATVTAEYDCLKLKLEDCLQEIKKVKVVVDTRYNGDSLKAYKVIKELKGLPEIIEELAVKTENLARKIKAICNVHVSEEIWQMKTFRKLDDYINNLQQIVPLIEKETKDKLIEFTYRLPKLAYEVAVCKELKAKAQKTNKAKKELAARKIKEIEDKLNKLKGECDTLMLSVNTKEENAKRAEDKNKELEEANNNLAILEIIFKKSHKEIEVIPNKLEEASKQLNDITKKRRQMLRKVTKYTEEAKECKDWIVRIINNKKKNIKNSTTHLTAFRTIEALSQFSTNEKKALVCQINNKKHTIQREFNTLLKTLEEKKSLLQRINDYFKRIHEDKDAFQVCIDNMHLEDIVFTLNDIENSKQDIEESKEVSKAKLIGIVNKLMKIHADIELEIKKQEKILKEEGDFPNELETELSDLVDMTIFKLSTYTEYLIKEFAKEENPYLACIDGKPAKVLLKCGHWICYKCYFTQNTCTACGGREREIGNFRYE